MNQTEALDLSLQYGDAFYYFDEARFVSNYHSLLGAFRAHYAPTQIAYSYKTNYTPAICRRIDELGGYAEVVSAMEYSLARRVGVDPEKIIYNGPLKSEPSIREALLAGSIVNLDSDRDLSLLLEVARSEPSKSMRVGIRCNFAMEQFADSRFGLDVTTSSFRNAVAAVRGLPNATLAGLHCHYPHRELRSFVLRSEGILKVARDLFNEPPKFISIGGGFFGSMPEAMRRNYPQGVPSFDDYGRAAGDLFAREFGATNKGPTLFIEPGTALVADSFEFAARIVDIKRIRGKAIACFAGSMFNVSPYSRSQTLPVTIMRVTEDSPYVKASETFDLAGYTCIESDVPARNISGPASVGDLVVFSNIGSYSIVMKPPFILPSVPILMKAVDGGMHLIKRPETADYIFENFQF